MSYFVTGATGFIGRHLVERLLGRKGQVYVLVRRQSRDKIASLKASLGPRGQRYWPWRWVLAQFMQTSRQKTGLQPWAGLARSSFFSRPLPLK